MLNKGVYVLELEGGNYYVGRSNNLPKRVKAHFEGRGAAFTKLHKPIRIVETIVGGVKVELQTTLKYVFIYGSDKVRGSIYVHTNPTETKIKLIEIKAKYYVYTGKFNMNWIDNRAIKYTLSH